ncbi:DUF3888 domain-containing protein [Bacillus luteolus]|uniref:DUF3888 domain-containing protein n=1 Tax=Litchfieldia luteola TaxID=682179 RepID=A0ABR9QNU9_9BACI|nr:DUF3888 domain-containing protein [Cytobacillus luteolus]MBE4909839.1 DUF3888 domain-containing protein [Cytobacillus luteolus]MBP1942612.1 hypothetical protein [Cytobacillus luteolus]
MFKKTVPILISLLLAFSWQLHSHADTLPTKDSTELQMKDMFMLLLSPAIDKEVSDYYSDFYDTTPLVYPYQINVVNTKRIGGFRTFHFEITIEVTPVVGPHVSVGKDKLTFEISPTLAGQIRLKEYKHLETHELPPNWQHIIKKKVD